MSNPNKTVLIERFPDKEAPEAYLRKVLKEYPSCGGYAVQTIEQGAPMLVSDRMDTGAQLEAVQALLKGYASSRVLLTFSKLEGVKEEFLQPFDFLMPGDVTPLMCFGVEGEFPSLQEGGITQEANFSKKVIIPNFNKFLKLSEGDLAKFIAEIKDPTFVDSLMARIGDRGVFCFLPPTGDAIWLGKNKLGSTYPWGQVSMFLDYVEQVSAAPVAEKKGGWWNVGPKVPVAQESPPPSPDKSPPLGLPDPKPDTKIDAPPATPSADPAAPPGHWEELPPGLSNKDKKSFVRRVTGCGNNLPEGYELKGWKYWVVDYPVRAKTLEALKDKLEAAGPKDMRSSEPPRIVAPTRGSEAITEANSLVLTADESTAAETTIVKIMDRQGKEIPNPLDIQKMEQKYPVFTKKFGVTSEQIDTWLPADIEAFAKAHGKAFFHLFLETRREKIVNKATLSMMLSKHLSSTETHALAQAELVPEPKVAAGGWSNWGK